MIPDKEERAKARRQYAAFRASEGSFGCEEALDDREALPPHQWWDLFGGDAPELQRVAVKVTSQVSGSALFFSCCQPATLSPGLPCFCCWLLLVSG
jgi:hypothetical protein